MQPRLVRKQAIACQNEGYEVDQERIQMDPILLQIKQETDYDASPKSVRKRRHGNYTNWFALELWPPVLAAISKHRNLSMALHYLEQFYK
jgi:hypothetical protein